MLTWIGFGERVEIYEVATLDVELQLRGWVRVKRRRGLCSGRVHRGRVRHCVPESERIKRSRRLHMRRKFICSSASLRGRLGSEPDLAVVLEDLVRQLSQHRLHGI